jgi:hypothetical protein
MAGGVTFTPNSNFVRTFWTPGGMTGRHLKVLGKMVQADARVLVGKRTGKLARSIQVGRVTSHPRGLEVEVGSKLSYAYMHHEGTRPHAIHARPGSVMRFKSRGRMVVTTVVHHPGTKANRYLLNALTVVIKFKAA